jgi:L-fuconolactonase
MIIDTHTHFYDPTRPQGVPWPRPNEPVLYKTMLPANYKAVAEPRGVTGTVVVEASGWVEDNQWVLDLAERDPFIVGLVGHLTPGADGFGPHLDAFTRNPLFRGIRCGLPRAYDEHDARLLADLEKLTAKDLELDLMSSPAELAIVQAMAARFPELRMVLCHVAHVRITGQGMVLCHVAHVRITGQAPDPVWVEGLQALKPYPNVYVKVSALVENSGQKPAPADLAYYRPTLDTLWETLGPDRLIYGSNWPVCLLFSDYVTVQSIVDAYFAAKGPEASNKYFWRNAQAAYKWVER